MRLLLLAACGLPLYAGMIRGVVLENKSGRPLARASVHLGVYGSAGVRVVRSVFADRAGGFVLAGVEPGQYVLSARRRLFAERFYGRERRPEWIAVGADTDFFVELRLQRLGVIGGSAFDENRVGLDGHPAVVYPAKPPYRVIASAKTDDRGVFRIAGLEPGRYLVRSGAYEVPGGEGMLPTFHPGSLAVREARVVAVELDGEQLDADIFPVAGRLSRVSGRLACTPQPGEEIVRIDVTLSSDTGNRKLSSGCDGTFSFDGVAPGDYELLAEAVWPRRVEPGGPIAAFQSLYVGRDTEANLHLRAPPQVMFMGAESASIVARRKDLSGFGEEVAIAPSTKPVAFTPGFWEVGIVPPAGRFVAAVEARLAERYTSKAGPSEDWIDLGFPNYGTYAIRVSMGLHPASLEGRVQEGTAAARFAPVVLFPKEAKLRQRVRGHRVVHASEVGVYRVADVAPGEYLVAASWDLGEVTEEALAAAGAKLVTLKEGEAAALDLELWRAR